MKGAANPAPVPRPPTDGEGLSRQGENRASSRASDRESRTSDRESRTSDRESRTSDRESRMSDRDGRTSVASRVSEATSDWSIYDVPPPPKTVGGGSDRGSLSYRSQTSEGGEDDGVYEVPPPPRSCRSSSASLRTSRDSRHLRPSSDELPQPATSPGSTSSSSAPVTRRGGAAAAPDTSGSKVVEPLPPPKPPRRSMCPPSPTPDAPEQEAGTYEAIFFKGQDQSDYENVDVQQKLQLQPPPQKLPPPQQQQQQQHGRARSVSATFTHGHSQAHDSSDSDYETPRPLQPPAHGHSNRMYSTISFKPVKSRRTSKLKDASHVYENTIHRYENFSSGGGGGGGGRYHTLRDRDRDHHHREHREQDLRDREHREAKDGTRELRHHHHHHHPHSSLPPAHVHPLHHHHNDNLHNQDNARDHRNETTSLRDRNENLRDRVALTLSRRPRAVSAFCRGSGGRGDSSEDSDGEHRPRSLELREARPKVRPQPLSPTHYQQPPTPDHPPPSARQAQISIHAKMHAVSRPPQEKRPVRDIETETEPEEVLALEAEGSSCSLSSVSERSVSTDHIEEVKSDVPFAGLFRGSVTPMEGPEVVSALERPRSLAASSGLRPALDRGCRNSSLGSLPAAREPCGSGGSSGSGGLGALLSPLDEAEEWARINDIMASFGGGLARESVFMAELEHEFQTRLGLSLSPSQQGLGLLSGGGEVGGVSLGVLESGDKTVGGWLRALGLPQYEDVFLAHGYDDTDFMNGGILEVSDLRELGITQASHVQALGEAVALLPTPFTGPQATYTLPDTVDAWLESIHLPQYSQNFHKNGFGEMERVRKVWEIELTTVLEITRPGHRKRILSSLGERPLEPELPPALNPHDLSLELTKLNSDISQLKEQLFNDLPSSTCRERRPPETATNTIRRVGTKKRSAPQPPSKAPRAQPSIDLQGSSEQLGHLPIRDPSQLAVGTPNTMLTTWRHHPNALVSASVQYVAQYLGSTHVKELKGTESTMKSIQKLKKTPTEGMKVPKIILSVSYRGVRFMDAVTQTLVCEHEIRNIHCASQDGEDLSHFAYITTDLETKEHYCHVFRVQNRDLAKEIILTLGEAFEVAYQLALREPPYTNQSDEQKLAHGHTRSKSEHLRGSRTLSNGSSHTRSHSTVPQQMSIGGVSSSSAENLLSDSGNGSEKECGSRRDSVSSVPSSQNQMNGS